MDGETENKPITKKSKLQNLFCRHLAVHCKILFFMSKNVNNKMLRKKRVRSNWRATVGAWT